ncbi:MAG: dicarboxylate/amino acid:cation symporter [Bryobacterales bacterium]|nr:dicarboxylate/amino acid:cation symporter [Bryobacterales bacterium]
MNSNLAVLAALAAGLALGWAVRQAGGAPEWLLDAATAIGTLWVNAIRMTALPLILSFLVLGVGSAADARTIGRLGGRAVALIVGALLFGSTLSALITPIALQWLTVDADTAAAWRGSLPEKPAQTAVQWVTSIIPVNPFQAAAEGTVLPLVIFSVTFSLALLFIAQERRGLVLQFAQAVADAMLVLLKWVLIAAPVGIAALAFTMTARIGLAAAGSLTFYLAVLCSVVITLLLLSYPVVAVLTRIPLRDLLRAFWPAQAVAASSRSSLAALPLMVEALQEHLKLPVHVAGFVLPLSVSMFRMSASISLVIAALFVARVNHIEFNAVQMVTMVLTTVLLTFSVPGIPNASFLMIVPLFQTMGLPVEPIGLLMAIDALPDIFKTTLNVTAQMGVSLVIARGKRTAV